MFPKAANRRDAFDGKVQLVNSDERAEYFQRCFAVEKVTKIARGQAFYSLLNWAKVDSGE